MTTSAPGNGDNNWWVATLDRIDLGSGAVTRIAAPRTQLNFPRVSPDGQTVVFIGGLMSDFGSVGGDIYTVPVSGGAPTDKRCMVSRANAAMDACSSSASLSHAAARCARVAGSNAAFNAAMSALQSPRALWSAERREDPTRNGLRMVIGTHIPPRSSRPER